MAYRLGRRAREFMALATRSIFLRLGANLRGTRLHVCMDFIVVGLQVIKHLILNCPFEEIELSHSCVQSKELNALGTAKGVEHLFAIRLEMRLVRKIDDHVTGVLREEGHVVLLCVIGDEPVHQTQADVGVSSKDVSYSVEILGA